MQQQRELPVPHHVRIAGVGLAVAMLSSNPLIAPDRAEALSYQERMEALEQRRQQLEATKAEAYALLVDLACRLLSFLP